MPNIFSLVCSFYQTLTYFLHIQQKQMF